MDKHCRRVRVRIIGELTALQLRPEVAEKLVKQGIAKYAVERQVETQMLEPREQRG